MTSREWHRSDKDSHGGATSETPRYGGACRADRRIRSHHFLQDLIRRILSGVRPASGTWLRLLAIHPQAFQLGWATRSANDLKAQVVTARRSMVQFRGERMPLMAILNLKEGTHDQKEVTKLLTCELEAP